MRRAGSLAGACLVLVLLASCGESQRFTDREVNEAVKVEDGSVGGDPFCEVGDVLNDAEEIEAARAGEAALLTSRQGNVGIEVVPPFPDDCERAVRKALSRLDPPERD